MKDLKYIFELSEADIKIKDTYYPVEGVKVHSITFIRDEIYLGLPLITITIKYSKYLIPYKEKFDLEIIPPFLLFKLFLKDCLIMSYNPHMSSESMYTIQGTILEIKFKD